ncbi:MAG: hypothetical protein EPO20_07415 [Betaproteobacteria bacterium]|nr:MAG: hypothetical protein EPO20_07415 [Betaproteobacteria bacterium]
MQSVLTLKEYLESLANRPATLQRPERRERHACARCDGEVFVLYAERNPVCAGCGAVLATNQSSRKS